MLPSDSSTALTHTNTLKIMATHTCTAPGDYDMTVTNLTFAPSDLDSDEQLVPVETQDDEIWESVEEFSAVISSVSPWVTISNGEAFASIDTDVDDGRLAASYWLWQCLSPYSSLKPLLCLAIKFQHLRCALSVTQVACKSSQLSYL